MDTNTQNTEMRNNTTTSSLSPENRTTDWECNESSGFYHRGHNAESVAEYIYKIRDDSVRLRQFLGTDTSDGIEAILADHQGHFLHEYIEGDDPLRPFIDVDLPQETLNPNLHVKR